MLARFWLCVWLCRDDRRSQRKCSITPADVGNVNFVKVANVRGSWLAEEQGGSMTQARVEVWNHLPEMRESINRHKKVLARRVFGVGVPSPVGRSFATYLKQHPKRWKLNCTWSEKYLLAGSITKQIWARTLCWEWICVPTRRPLRLCFYALDTSKKIKKTWSQQIH